MTPPKRTSDKRGRRVCLLLLGGNMGQRKRTLLRALAGLETLPGGRVLKASRFFETAPVGPSRGFYLNAAALYATSLTPMGLLVECKRLEALAGRRPGPRWGARPLDIDIIDYAGRRLRSPWLVLPHPRTAGRAFALAPLCDVAPSWRPKGGETVRRLLARLKPGPAIVRIVPDGR